MIYTLFRNLKKSFILFYISIPESTDQGTAMQTDCTWRRVGGRCIPEEKFSNTPIHSDGHCR